MRSGTKSYKLNSGILAIGIVIVFLTNEFRSQVIRNSTAAARKLVDQGSGSIYLSRPQESRWLRRFVRRTKVDKPERGRESRIRSHRTRVSGSFDPESQQISDSSESRSAPVFSRFLSSFRSRARTLSDCSATRCYVLHSRYIATTMHERFLRTCTCTRGRKRYFRNGIFRNGIHIYPMQR